jgi:hypothetical protein
MNLDFIIYRKASSKTQKNHPQRHKPPMNIAGPSNLIAQPNDRSFGSFGLDR